jgi:hypothetical protein
LRAYTIEPGHRLYPTAGTSDDYFYSRHFVDTSRGQVIGFTLEWGSPRNPTPFHPPYSEMQQIIDEIVHSTSAFGVRRGVRPFRHTGGAVAVTC